MGSIGKVAAVALSVGWRWRWCWWWCWRWWCGAAIRRRHSQGKGVIMCHHEMGGGIVDCAFTAHSVVEWGRARGMLSQPHPCRRPATFTAPRSHAPRLPPTSPQAYPNSVAHLGPHFLPKLLMSRLPRLEVVLGHLERHLLRWALRGHGSSEEGRKGEDGGSDAHLWSVRQRGPRRRVDCVVVKTGPGNAGSTRDLTR